MLIERAIERHGDWSRWSRLEAITVRPLSLRGLLPWMKGHSRSFVLPASITAFPKRWRTEFGDYPSPGTIGIFEGGDVSLVEAASARTLTQSRHHRGSFRGLRNYRRWGALDALYFFGYAFASYAAAPFILPRCRLLEAFSGSWNGERLDGARVEFPEGLDVHSRVQSYFFDRSGLLRRNDYVAQVVGWWAQGAHRLDDYAEVDGIPIPRRRTVLPRLGRRCLPGPVTLAATFGGLAVRFANGDGDIPNPIATSG
jgi:hypothetical protein